MANLIYRIHKGKKNIKTGHVPIIATVSIEGKTKWKVITWINPKYWNPQPEMNKWLSTGRTGTDDHKRNLEVNQLLKDYKTRVTEYFFQCIKDGRKITFDLVSTYLDGNDPKPPGEINFWSIYETYLQSGQTDSGAKEASTRRADKMTRNKLQKFEKETGFKMAFENIDSKFQDRFMKWIFEEKKNGWNFYCSHIKRFKTFLNWSLKRGDSTNLEFKKIKAKEKEGTIIYLTEAELKTLFNFNFENPKHSRARDLFCFACFTGLRYSDLYTLTREHILNNEIIKYPYKVKKDKEPLHVPLAPQAMEIINRYLDQYKVLPKLSGQKLNETIKKASEIAGIKTMTVYKDFTGGTAQELTARKCDLISSHTGRKTFICTAFARGMDTQTIMKLTGISNFDTLRRYLFITKETTREAVNSIFQNI